MPMTAPVTEEPALATFLEQLPEDGRLEARAVVQAWRHAGGRVQAGRFAVRLLGHDQGGAFTAATLHLPRAPEGPRLELARVLLQAHGLDQDAFMHWADELAEIQPLGFDPERKFPAIPLDGRLGPAGLARLVGGMRDLARAATGAGDLDRAP